MNEKACEMTDGFASNLRDALPNASFIGFTGAPLEKTDANTRAVFGDYISINDIQRAVTDKATVPIYYTCGSCNQLKRHYVVADPCQVALEDCLEMHSDGTIRPRNNSVEGRRLIGILGLDDPCGWQKLHRYQNAAVRTRHRGPGLQHGDRH